MRRWLVEYTTVTRFRHCGKSIVACTDGGNRKPARHGYDFRKEWLRGYHQRGDSEPPKRRNICASGSALNSGFRIAAGFLFLSAGNSHRPDCTELCCQRRWPIARRYVELYIASSFWDRNVAGHERTGRPRNHRDSGIERRRFQSRLLAKQHAELGARCAGTDVHGTDYFSLSKYL